VLWLWVRFLESSGQFGGVVLWLWVRLLESRGVKYGLTCSKAYSLLNQVCIV
jgi:hypothetical protein